MRDLFLLFFCFVSSFLFGQVQSVDYLMEYNCETNKYDVSIVILDGTASSIPQRAQFNAQVTIVVPTRNSIYITDKYMPLQNNQSYNGTLPLDWDIGGSVYAPVSQPLNDFHAIIPTLAPASFYNNLAQNDIVTLFSFTAGSSGEYDENVRFFENGIDPNESAPGMEGSDFSNGFTIGGITQLYNSNLYETCTTNTNEENLKIANVYPNPFHEQVTIELFSQINNITVLNSIGKIFYDSYDNSKETITIQTDDFPSGVYFVRIKNEDGIITTHKIMKI